MNTTITTTITVLPASLLEVDGHHIIAVEHDGTLYAGLACIITPRDGSPLGLQAFTEMDDAGEIPDTLADIPEDMPNVSEPPLPFHPDLAPLTVSSI